MSRSGRRTVVRHRNELPVPVIVHLHGGRTPPEHDGNAGKYAFHCHNLEREDVAMMGNDVTG